MSSRERNLLMAAAGVAVLVIGWQGYVWTTGALDAKRSQLTKLEQEITKQRGIVRRGEQATRQLAEWEEQSLPANVELARAQYQKWLLDAVGKAGFDDANVDTGRLSSALRTGENGQREVVYYRLPFTVSGRGTLEELTRFLYGFYRLNHLHRIQRMSVQPIEKSKKLELTMSIDALVLPGAMPEKPLAKSDSRQLAWDDLKDYEEVIVKRNLFAEYTPPPPPPRPVVRREERPKPPPRPTPSPKPRFDPSKHAFVTAIVEIGNRPQVWINSRTDGKTFKVSPGEKIEIGPFEATVLRIGNKNVILHYEGKRWLLALGDNLHDGAELPEGDL